MLSQFILPLYLILILFFAYFPIYFPLTASLIVHVNVSFFLVAVELYLYEYQETMSIYAGQIKIANPRLCIGSSPARGPPAPGSSGKKLLSSALGTVCRLRAARSVDAAADWPSDERWLTDDSGPGPLPDRLMDFRCRTSGDRLSPTSDRLSPTSDRLSPSSDRVIAIQ